MPDLVKTYKLYKSPMRKGDSGDAVWAAKQRLFELGFYSTKIKEIKSRSLGDDSVLAIKRFQLKKGLVADGVIGQLTWNALFGFDTESEVVTELDSSIIENMRALCQKEVDNGSIYVWASGGELGTSVDEAWIRKKENRNNNGANFDRAYRLWIKRIEAGNVLFRCFDCSGFVSFILRALGVFNGRRDCDGLYSLSTPLDSPVDGCLVFRQSSTNPNDETHVGLYIGGYVFHAKGRDVGVVCEKYSSKYWHKCAWFKAVPR